MATQLQIRRGTSAQVAAFTGAEGEVVVNTTNDSVHVNDGSTAGGFELARVDGSNWAITNAISTTANISFGDNDKAIFGAGSDLELFYNGTHSVFKDGSAGNIYIQDDNNIILGSIGGENYLVATKDGAVTLYHDAVAKLATTSTGIDVTGTVTADGLTVDGTVDGTAVALLRADNTGVTKKNTLRFEDTDTTTQNDQQIGRIEFYSNDTDHTGVDAVIEAVSATTGLKELRFLTSNTANTPLSRLDIASNGDISFYEDTGTNARVVWDSSAETFAIGNIQGSAAGTLKVKSDSDHRGLVIEENNGQEVYQLGVVADGSLVFQNSGSEVVRFDDSGNVGIGTSSPSKQLHQIRTGSASDLPTLATETGFITQSTNVAASSQNISIIAGASGESRLFFGDTADEDVGHIIYNHASNYMLFSTAATGAMRIDSNQNLLVGKTSTTFGTVGVENRADGRITSTRSGNTNLLLNRLSSDGDLVQFYKDGASVGSIACNSDTSNAYMIIGKGAVGLQFARDADANNIMPARPDNQSLRDNAIDLGSSSFRFDDIYATNGTIQTSDRNEKQDIEALSDAEQRVAVAAKGLLRKFRWKSAVEEKGDDARIHFGIIAQDLQDAFSAEGLDAGRYAMFISSTWTDDDGNEQTRLGVRYSELLAFIISAI